MISKITSQLMSPLSPSSLSSQPPSSSSGGQNSPASSTDSYNNSDRNNPLSSSSSSFASFLNFNHHHRNHYQSNGNSHSQLNSIYDHFNDIHLTNKQSLFKVSSSSSNNSIKVTETPPVSKAPIPFARKKHVLQQQQLSQQRLANKFNNEFSLKEIVPTKVAVSKSPLHYNSSSLTKSYNSKHTKKMSRKSSPFDKLNDETIGKIFGFLTADELCTSSPRVCKRWYSIIWSTPNVWTRVTFSENQMLNIDRALRSIFRLLSRDSSLDQPTTNSDPENKLCHNSFYSLKRPISRNSQFVNHNYYSTENLDSVSNVITSVTPIQVIKLTSAANSSLTDRGLLLVAHRCPELRCFVVNSCANITNLGLSEILAKCSKIKKLDISGCGSISLNTSRACYYPQLNYLDISNCMQVDDYNLKRFIKSHGSRLQYFYCRRNDKVSDESISSLVKYCPLIREISISDCPNITDITCDLSSKIGSNLKYLSISKCDRVTDKGLEQMARFCFNLRYLNVRGCPAISDAGICAIARSCGPRLKALDVGKCNITDEGLKILSENCTNLRKLGLRDCHMLSDTGISLFAYYCRSLTNLNLTNCSNITREAFLYVKRCNKKCKIEHSNPNFY